MIVGPCGIVCTICRFYHRGLCAGCVRGDRCPPAKAVLSPCPILRCAAARKNPYCARDCPDFPCIFFEDRFPRCWSQMRASQRDRTLLDNEIVARTPMARSAVIPQKPVREKVRVFCLGPFRVYRGHTEIRDREWGQGKGPARKIKAMFAYLLNRQAVGARKETLIDLLWPEQTDLDRAGASFHLTLHCLRRALEPDSNPVAGSNYIRYEHGRYRFKPRKPYWLDAEAFEFYCRRAEACHQYGDVEAAMLYWGMALDLYAGDYMAGIDRDYTENRYHDWCVPHRQHLQRLYLKALLKKADYYYTNQRPGLCLKYARKILDLEPGMESAHRLVRRCLITGEPQESTTHQYQMIEAEAGHYEARAPSEQTRQRYERMTADIIER